MLIYNIGIYIFVFGLKVASLFHRKAKLMVRGYRGMFRELEDKLAGHRTIWIHAASLGEFEQGRTVIESLREAYPGHKILLTFFSPSGYEVRKNYDCADYVCYLPLDTARNARRFVNIVQPEITVFIKYEFWLNYLKQLRKHKYRTYIISAIFRLDSIFFKPYGGLFRRGLRTFERIFVQDDNSKKLLETIEILNVTVVGDTRFDRVSQISAAAKDISVIEDFTEGQKVFVAGSTWDPDENILAGFAKLHPGVKLIVVPHEVGEHHIERLSELFASGSYLRYTLCDTKTDFTGIQVLIVDTVGLLSSVYRYASFAYIGGGFGAGIHNILEAATFGLPTAFGPNYHKFREARELVELGSACPVEDLESLQKWYDDLADNPQRYAEAKAKALSYISYNTGATAKIMAYLISGKIDT